MSQLIKRILPEDKFFAVVNLISGYHQVELPEEYRDLFAIILVTGKYRYRRLPQGTNLSPDIFNIVTDGEVRDVPWISANVWSISTVCA